MAKQAQETEKPKAEAAAAPAEPEPNFEVSVQHGPTVRVYAKDAANAWEAYKTATGMISTSHQPEIKSIA